VEEKQKLHIVAFDVPYPPNYGGIVDVYYKLKSLHEAGAEIYYHCFYYKGHNPPTDELKKYCKELHFYERKKSLFKLLFNKLPYVVSTRSDTILLMRLMGHQPAPILFDGIQTTFWFCHEDLMSMPTLYRANNIEHDYYAGLAAWERNPLKSLYLKREAKKLRRYEWNLKKSSAILSVAKMDIPHFEQYAKTHHVPPFFNDSPVVSSSGERVVEGEYVLFQGNLSVKENEYAAVEIANYIAPHCSHKIIVAGKNPSRYLKKVLKTRTNIELIASPSIEVMDSLIEHANVNLLMTFQQTGIKLKLLHALQSGKHIIINSKMDDSGIFGEMCYVIDENKAIASKIDELISEPFTAQMKAERDVRFNKYYNNKLNAENILKIAKEEQLKVFKR